MKTEVDVRKIAEGEYFVEVPVSLRHRIPNIMAKNWDYLESLGERVLVAVSVNTGFRLKVLEGKNTFSAIVEVITYVLEDELLNLQM